jgi:hypothetical protein
MLNQQPKLVKTYQVDEILYSTFTMQFEDQDQMNEYVKGNPEQSVGGIDVNGDGSISAFINETKQIVFFPNEISRDYFVKNNEEFNVISKVYHKKRIACWVEPK